MLYGSVASLPSPSSNIETWPNGTSLRFASLLHLGHQGYVNIFGHLVNGTFGRHYCRRIGLKFLSPKWLVTKNSLPPGVVLNYNSETPNIFKSGIVSGFVHRIFNTCFSWPRFHDGLMKAQKILRDNQYPTGFIEKTTSHTLDNILAPVKSGLPAKPNRPKADLNIGLKLMYNGPSSIIFAKNLKKTLEPLASLNIHFTTTKLRSNLPLESNCS